MVKLFLMILFNLTMTTVNQSRLSHSRIMDEREHKVIMQVSSLGAGEQQVIVSQINNLLNSLPKATVKVVFHSQGLPLVVAKESKVALEVASLLKRGVIFDACENTMERKGITKEDLLPRITTVPSAIAEFVLKQEEGWIYVKAGL